MRNLTLKQITTNKSCRFLTYTEFINSKLEEFIPYLKNPRFHSFFRMYGGKTISMFLSLMGNSFDEKSFTNCMDGEKHSGYNRMWFFTYMEGRRIGLLLPSCLLTLRPLPTYDVNLEEIKVGNIMVVVHEKMDLPECMYNKLGTIVRVVKIKTGIPHNIIVSSKKHAHLSTDTIYLRHATADERKKYYKGCHNVNQP